MNNAPGADGSNSPAGPGRDAARFLNTYFRSAPSPSLDEIAVTLWNGPPRDVTNLSDAALIEQYKIYVEMADRVSARRGLANTFFLTLNTSIVAAAAVAFQNPPPARAILIVPWVALIGQCLGWFWTIRSYRQLNTAKYAVIGALELRLPASPYWAAEWTALGGGRDPSRYWPISHVETWIPFFFAAAYTACLVVLLVI